MASKPLFLLPEIQDNPSGWGPCAVPSQFKDVPYQPFSKSDRLGKASDWTGSVYSDKKYLNRYQPQIGGGGAGSMYSYIHDEDDVGYRLVDTSKVQRSVYQKQRQRITQQRMQRAPKEKREKGLVQPLTKAQKSRDRDRMRQERRWRKNQRGRIYYSHSRGPQKLREPSVEVKGEWEIVQEVDFQNLAKLRIDPPEPEDLKQYGTMGFYDKSYDRVNTKNEKPLRGINRIFHKVTTSDDPVIPELSQKYKDSEELIVFATDAILSTLMTCTRSVYSWDIVAQRVGKNFLFLDKRDKSQFDLMTVNETAVEPPQDDGSSMNAPANLALEATFINQNFSQQVLRKEEGAVHQFGDPNPFVDEEEEGEVASVGYRYRKFQLSENVQLIARCELDAALPPAPGSTDIQCINIKALNEWDPQIIFGASDWRHKLDTQRGAVLATELKNNSFKLAKWTMSAILAGSHLLKFGYVSRLHPYNSTKHVILGTQQYRPKDFATQINLDVHNSWGILRVVVDLLLKLAPGKYLILKDPNKAVIRIYNVPQAEFESEEEDEDDDDDAGSGDDDKSD
ncbi:eukaryotic translation initiation factor 3 subunit D-like isoform X2 [Oscarella lobularis]|uniref:eukaryotic translation initiation factor 3 subunit D-like isoform X2 n=1 Tax=Oscarella lobularis TaxID=121494 RepID=UPI003313BD3D